MTSTLLMLADGRFPSGSHAHSGGLEAAVAAGRVRTLSDVERFLQGRLATAGSVMAAFAAAAHQAVSAPHPETLAGLEVELDARMSAAAVRLAGLEVELDARMSAAAVRAASRRQGKALARAGRLTWPSPIHVALVKEPHHAIALGVVAAAAGLSDHDGALTAAYGVVTGPASAAVRLLGLDPYAVQAILARLAPATDEVANAAVIEAKRPPEDLPDWAAPLSDIAAEHHATWEVRLFAS